jgi:hypothetical protein
MLGFNGTESCTDCRERWRFWCGCCGGFDADVVEVDGDVVEVDDTPAIYAASVRSEVVDDVGYFRGKIK